MKHLNYIVFSAVALLLAALPMRAQYAGFSCDFENATQNTLWSMNNKPVNRPALVLENLWCIGAEGQFGPVGSQGLLITNDTVNKPATYSATQKMFTVAYIDISSATNALVAGNTYTLRFDYRLAGSTTAKLHAWLVPSTFNPVSNTSAAPNYTSRPGIKLAENLFKAPTWRTYSTTFTPVAEHASARLVFIWESDASNPNPCSACIDNIEVIEGTGCASTPSGITYTNGNLVWSQVQGASSYEVMAYNTFNSTFTAISTVTTTSWTPTFTDEGYCNLYVRAICPDGSHSAWGNTSTFVFLKGARCLDYMDLDAAICYLGPFDNVAGQGVRGKIDHGYDNIQSHHTIHYLKGETDPRTQNRLKTIPDGEIASVRLGNWLADNSISSQGAGEAIEYKYKVQGGASDIMVLQYAVVMEKPGHNDGTDPHFTLEILDQHGRQIGGGIGENPVTCFKADFAAASNNPIALIGWNEWNPGNSSGVEGAGYSPIIWKPWTKVTVSLRKYVGQTLTIRFTTMDCRQSAHWAYAYITIGCQSGDLKGITCGDFDTQKFTAPDGFLYEWYNPKFPGVILSDSAVFELPGGNKDTTTYCCDVFPLGGGRCGYTLTANPNPLFPIANIIVDSISHRGCTNRVYFTNKSYVAIINRETYQAVPSDQDTIETVDWDFGGLRQVQSNDKHQFFEFPAEGGQYTITARASIGDGACDSVWTYTLNLPNLTQATVEKNIEICNGESYTYHTPNGDIVVTENFTDTIFGINQYGCDALQITNVKVLEAYREPTDTVRICDTETYFFGGKQLNKTGFYTDTLLTKRGCDSILSLDLTVNPKLKIEMQPTYRICPEDIFALPFTVTHGQYDSVTVFADAQAVAQGFQREYGFRKADMKYDVLNIELPNAAGTVDDFVRAGTYKFEVHPHSPFEECTDDVIPVTLHVSYSSSVVVQYGSYLFLFDPEHNGGYDQWVSYQWYHNGQPIPGYTSAQILMPDTSATAEYYCLITDSLGNAIPTCPVHYQQPQYVGIDNMQVLHVYPTLVEPGQAITIVEGGKLQIYDAVGRLISTATEAEGTQMVISAPQVSGVYLLRAGSRTARIIVK